ncbi:MAG: C4-dicarboxylate ABC transporter, partial [bacterium]|nr:C4-dicarboxylate ABC transporter [bacterium]
MQKYRLITIALLLVTLAGPLHAVQLKIATVAPDGSTWMKEAKKAASEISERTNGRVSFRFYPGGTMGNAAMVLRKMRVGQLHGGVFTAGNFADISPDVQVYSLPLLFRSHAEVDHVRSQIDRDLLGKLEAKGYIAFGLIEGGFARIMTTRPATSFADLKGMKAWFPEGDEVGKVLVFEAGLSPVPLPLPDVLTGLQTGLIEAATGPPIAAIALQWFTKARYLIDLPIIYTTGFLAMSDKAFKRISAEDQEIVRASFERMSVTLNSATRKDNQGAFEALKNQGVAFTVPDEKFV